MYQIGETKTPEDFQETATTEMEILWNSKNDKTKDITILHYSKKKLTNEVTGKIDNSYCTR